MSGLVALRAVLLTALRGDAALMALVNAVQDGGAPKSSPPSLALGDLFATEWGARGLDGWSVRVPLTLADRADLPDRLGAAAARIHAVLGALPAEADGWRIGTVRHDRARTARGSDGHWAMMIDYLVRMARSV